MRKNYTHPRGTIEGFFGKSWSWDERSHHLQFLAQYGYNFYIYAPKSDSHLRRHWQEDWTTETRLQLQTLANQCRALQLDFGIGLSPLEIYLDPSQDQRQKLHQRIQQINQLSPDILCILFDDMRGDIPGLAQLQVDIVHQAASSSTAKRIIFCPTYYSFDPVLEKVFGKMPGDYWAHLAQHLDKKIDIFWTGEKVCSPHYSQSHLQQVTELFGRKPFLWDNYPVNDGAVKSKLLQLRSFPHEHSQLSSMLSGHAINPMNQPRLSEIALASLTQAYALSTHYNPDIALKKNLVQLCGHHLAQDLRLDIAEFQDKGLSQFSDEQKKLWIKKYSAHLPNPYAREIVDWLQGVHVFDPACLTD
jgi:hyaluronoglucosaminidase